MDKRWRDSAARSAAAIILACLGASMMLSGCDTGSLVSTSDEVTVGKQAAAQVESQHRVIRTGPEAELVHRIGSRVTAMSDRKDVNYTVDLLDDPEVNAVSLPGGWIYVYSGLVHFLDSNPVPHVRGQVGKVTRDDMLACVIGHETGHVAARHAAKMMGRSAVYGVALSALTKGNTQQWASVFANVDMLRYSRDDEYQADQLGEVFASRAGYNPWGMVAFLTLLQQKYPTQSGTLAQIMATHPSNPDRIARAAAQAAQLTGGG